LTTLASLALPLGLAAALSLGGPRALPPMASISAPFKGVDFSTLPAPSTYTARDGRQLAYRAYAPTVAGTRGSVVLIHGSSASSRSMHVLAQALAQAGLLVCALDMRGHGDSGPHGHIDHVGQLEDDLQDFMRARHLPTPVTLVGFSSGGGFALRVAGGAHKALFDNYLLLSPFISQDAANYRPGSGGWVSVGLPRLLALNLFNTMGLHAFNGLAVTRFALPEGAPSWLTPTYDWALAQNFRPQADYLSNIRAVSQPMRVIAGRDDEVFYAERLAGMFQRAGKPVPVTLIDGVNHMGLTLSPAAVAIVANTVREMSVPRPPQFAMLAP
jgi:alpha-beta hydrolase superfamily lysophospholipase